MVEFQRLAQVPDRSKVFVNLFNPGLYQREVKYLIMMFFRFWSRKYKGFLDLAGRISNWLCDWNCTIKASSERLTRMKRGFRVIVKKGCGFSIRISYFRICIRIGANT